MFPIKFYLTSCYSELLIAFLFNFTVDKLCIKKNKPTPPRQIVTVTAGTTQPTTATTAGTTKPTTPPTTAPTKPPGEA